MKIAIETHELIKRFDEDRAFSILGKAGFDGVDFSFFGLDKKKKEEVLGENYVEYAQKVKKLLDKYNLVCNQAHAPFDFNINKDCAEEGNDNYLQIVRAIRSASIMGAKIIIVHPQYAYKKKNFLQTNINFYKGLERYAVESGIVIGVENIFPSRIKEEDLKPLGDRFAYPISMQEIMAQLDNAHFAVCLDVGHSAVVGVEPEDFIKAFDKETLRALHIHDNHYRDDEHLIPFMGKISWDKVMQALKEIEYQGYFTFEVTEFLNKFDEELIVDAVHFVAKIGKRLVQRMG